MLINIWKEIQFFGVRKEFSANNHYDIKRGEKLPYWGSHMHKLFKQIRA
jgi:hypothetical protein